MRLFNKENPDYLNQFTSINWIKEKKDFDCELRQKINLICENNSISKPMRKAKAFEIIANEAPVAVDKEDIFQEKIFSGNIIGSITAKWQNEIVNTYLKEENTFINEMWKKYGVFKTDSDFGHTSPNSKLLLDVGFRGLYERLEQYSTRESLTNKQIDFYDSCKITIRAIETIIERLADAVKPYNEDNYIALKNLSHKAPGNIYEAMQLLIVYFYIHEYVYGTRVRTLGRLDVLLQPFYERDTQNGTFTKAEIKEMLKFFLYKIWLMNVPFDLPFALGGMDENGNDVTNDMSYLIVETYNELNIYSPKIHIKVCEKTPQKFIKLVLNCIRGGNSSFVFVNDEVAIRSLVKVGIKEKDARNYVPIGCYEPAVWGVEMGCTDNGGLNLAKMAELVLTCGYDNASDAFLNAITGTVESYEDFVREIKKLIEHYVEYALHYVRKIEGYYGEINPEAILSSMYDESAERGVDVYEGGAKYNNSSFSFYGIASLVDSLAAIKKIVFEEKKVTYTKFCEILKNNWQGYETLRNYAQNECPKYGNNIEEVDEIAVDIANFIADVVNNKPNGRGGVFKATCFSIDYCFTYGHKTMATPDGRFSGTPLSKNLSPTNGMDKEGITSLIQSVTKMDLSKFPNGSVLDVVLHPTAVSGEEGLECFYAVLKTYFQKGGMAMHGNVFDAETLRDAQKHPDKYRNLQVRLCGWNVFFVNLTKEEQDSFIAQAK